MLEVVAEALRNNEIGLGDFNIDLINVIAVARAQSEWLNALSQGIFVQLVLEILNARVRYLVEHPMENGTDDEVEPTAANRLSSAIADFANILLNARRDGRWHDAEVVARLSPAIAAVNAGDISGITFGKPGATGGTTASNPATTSGTTSGNDIAAMMAEMEEEVADEDEKNMDMDE
jgi:hypothetical protein